jgi:transcriptional regulator with XRE-family HTH domain
MLRSGRHLKAARVLAGMTQRQLAAAAGLHTNAVKYWERETQSIGGHAVGRMVTALAANGIECAEERAAGRTVAVLRG